MTSGILGTVFANFLAAQNKEKTYVDSSLADCRPDNDIANNLVMEEDRTEVRHEQWSQLMKPEEEIKWIEEAIKYLVYNLPDAFPPDVNEKPIVRVNRDNTEIEVIILPFNKKHAFARIVLETSTKKMITATVSNHTLELESDTATNELSAETKETTKHDSINNRLKTTPSLPHPVVAPMPGKILEVKCKVGDTVKAGQILLILEAMKMQNEIMAPVDGIVTNIFVSPGATVNTGDELVIVNEHQVNETKFGYTPVSPLTPKASSTNATGSYTLRINGLDYTVAEKTVAATITAPMPGVVLKVKCKNGDWVSKGQTLLILEAMKMQNEIMAPADGYISEIRVKAGSTVNTGDVMIVM